MRYKLFLHSGKGQLLFQTNKIPFTYTSKKSFIEMICSKKQIKLSKQPHYEHRADSSLAVTISDPTFSTSVTPPSVTPTTSTSDLGESQRRRSTRTITPTLKNYNDEPVIEEIDEDSPLEEIPLLSDNEKDSSQDSPEPNVTLDDKSNQLKHDLKTWFLLESKYKYISKYSIIDKAIQWADSLGLIKSNEKINDVLAHKWVKKWIKSENIGLSSQKFAVRTNELRKSSNSDVPPSLELVDSKSIDDSPLVKKVLFNPPFSLFSRK